MSQKIGFLAQFQVFFKNKKTHHIWIASLVKMSSKFDHISVGYVQKIAQKQPKIVLSKLENYKWDINETWPRYVTAEYLQYNKNEGVNEWVGGDATKTTTRKSHEINRNLTLTFKTSLENAKEIWIFHCHP